LALTAIAQTWFGGDIVDQSVAIVVKTVTDFRLWLGCCAALPTPVGASFFAFAAGSFAHTGQILIYFPIAVIVFAVASFLLWFGGGTTLPFALVAGFCARSAGCLTSADQAVVNHAVAVVINPVAYFGGRGASGRRAAHLRAIGSTHELARAVA
jgi:hypothetical protein